MFWLYSTDKWKSQRIERLSTKWVEYWLIEDYQ